MYKALLCWRYLRTRYLAVVCIVSVMLGVATLIVVNSVMSGFSTKLKQRIHGLMSDVVIDAGSFDGFPDPEGKMKLIRESPVGPHVAAMAAVVEVPAMIQFRPRGQHGWRGEPVTKPVRLIAVDAPSRAALGGFAEHLVRQRGEPSPNFDVPREVQMRYQVWRPEPAPAPSTVATPQPPAGLDIPRFQ